MCKFLLFVTGTYEDYNNNINDIHRRCIENINENSKSAIKYRDIAGGENPSLTASYVKNYIKFQKINKFML